MIRRAILLTLLGVCLPLHGGWQERVASHVILEDYHQAEAEMQTALKAHPDDAEVLRAYVELCAAAGWDQKLIQAWRHAKEQDPSLAQDSEVVERVAWGMLRAGAKHPGLMVQFYSLVGATLAQDVRGVDLVAAALNQQNSALRSLAAKLASHLGDTRLRRRLVYMIEDDPDWSTRLEAARAAGQLRESEALDALSKMLADSALTTEEKAIAIEASVRMFESVDPGVLKGYLTSGHPGLRSLACSLVLHFHLTEHLPAIEALLADTHPMVRQSALTTLTLLEAAKQEKLRPLLDDPQPKVAITAAWAFAAEDPETGIAYLAKWVEHPYQEYRLLAAGALNACGAPARSQVRRLMKHHDDPYVRATVAWGLVGQRDSLELAADRLYALAMETSTPLMWWTDGPFRAIGPSKIRHAPYQPERPETVDQLLRLDVLNVLAQLRDPRAPEALRTYFKKRAWVLPATAMMTFLGEVEATYALDVAKKLLEDDDPQVRIHAALVLALWGKDPDAIATLIEGYVPADQALKEQILQGLAQVRSDRVLAFLQERLSEGAPSLRVLAAAAYIQLVR